MHESPFLNLYLYPAEADYARSRPLGERWQRLDSCVRSVDGPFELPPGEGALVYVSLGSLGSADVELLNRLVASLAETPHRYVVSKGPQHESIELAANMTGAEFLPQPAILPHVDLVITHGGNNTVTESIHFGKPMVVLPLFLDQYDNASASRRSASACACRPTSSRTPSCTARSSGCSRPAGRPRRSGGPPAGRAGNHRAADLIAKVVARAAEGARHHSRPSSSGSAGRRARATVGRPGGEEERPAGVLSPPWPNCSAQSPSIASAGCRPAELAVVHELSGEVSR